MVVEPSKSGMADVPLKTNLTRKSAFSCEACRKRKVGFLPLSARVNSEGDISDHPQGVGPSFVYRIRHSSALAI
jgi:hypothetical protein